MFELQFPDSELRTWAGRYDYAPPDDLEVTPEKAGQYMQRNRQLSKPLFVELCRWKTQRNTQHYQGNGAAFIQEVTHVALTSPSERLRIEVLRLLDGVQWPVGSVILHFGHHDPYPILDRRAFWSLGFDEPPRYDFEVWEAYVHFCRSTARKHGISIRELDKALWKYSKENQD